MFNFQKHYILLGEIVSYWYQKKIIHNHEAQLKIVSILHYSESKKVTKKKVRFKKNKKENTTTLASFKEKIRNHFIDQEKKF